MKLAAAVEYDGGNFHGWQRQKGNIRTVQMAVEEAFGSIANHPVRVFCAGRTDAGVHAEEQIVHFETDAKRPLKSWLFGSNSHLPKEVNVRWVRCVDDDFHARFSAIARQYQYRILTNPVRSSLLRNRVLFEPRKLHIPRLQSALNMLLGCHDFSAFRSSICQAKSPIKTIEQIRLEEIDRQVVITIKADAFLHHMVRNVIGTVLCVARGDRDLQWLNQVIHSKNRQQAGMTAPPHALYFMRAFYPSRFGI